MFFDEAVINKDIDVLSSLADYDAQDRALRSVMRSEKLRYVRMSREVSVNA